jgi:uncharacterized protein
MEFQFDPDKRKKNLAKHKMDFVVGMRLIASSQKMVKLDNRQDYGEERFQAIGEVDGIFVITAFTMRDQAFRIISVRKAHKKEIKLYLDSMGE